MVKKCECYLNIKQLIGIVVKLNDHENISVAHLNCRSLILFINGLSFTKYAAVLTVSETW